MNKKILTTAIVVSAVGLCILGTGSSASAFSETNRQSLADKIASKFNLDSSAVSDVMNEHREEMESERQAQYEEYLSEKVTAGTITEAQKKLLLDKREEMKQARLNAESDTTKADRETMKAELDKWAEENGISTELLMMGRGGRGGRGMHNQ